MLSKDRKLAIVYRPLAELRVHPRNARTHTDKQIAQLKGSISQFGFTNPILIDENGQVIAGHARLEAATGLLLADVPTILIEGLTDKQKRRLMLADNKIALNAGWDADLLRLELTELAIPDADFDISAIGFDTHEIDLLMGGETTREKDDPLDKVDAIDRSQLSIAQPGDLWMLGDHRILVGNSLDEAAYATLMDGEVAGQVVTDPPYNVRIDGHVGGLGEKRHAEFPMASGEMTDPEFTAFLSTALQRMAAVCKDGAILHCFIDWRHIAHLLAAGTSAQLSLINLCVWSKTNGGMGSLYRSQHELVPVFKHGNAPHTNNVELGAHGRYRTNVWSYPGANSFRKGRKQDLATHPTVKPIAMIMDAIKDCSQIGEIILDPFGGSGTTLLAAERTRRRGRLIELDPYYVDATIRRWQTMTSLSAVHCTTGATFDTAISGEAA